MRRPRNSGTTASKRAKSSAVSVDAGIAHQPQPKLNDFHFTKETEQRLLAKSCSCIVAKLMLHVGKHHFDPLSLRLAPAVWNNSPGVSVCHKHQATNHAGERYLD